ncbi:AAA family ATPase [Serratia marcescens]|uniref:AAA family ATPase n=1 Tax=Serratia TaxID=613 RepID=UPI0018D980B2|nr:AAA family ATPase [Serratia marcescens]
MKIKLSNFGPIREFEIDLDKDFHLLIGQNNIGKSYAITAIYLILKSLIELKTIRGMNFSSLYYDYMMDKGEESNTNEKLLADLFKGDKQEIDISDTVNKNTKEILAASFVRSLTNSFTSTFTSLTNLENKFNVGSVTTEIKLSAYNIDITLSIRDGKIIISNIKSPDRYVLKKSKRNRNIHYGANDISIYYRESEADSGRSSEMDTHFTQEYGFLISVRFRNVVQRLTSGLNGVHYLPASRSGLYQALSAFGQIIAELSRNRSFLSKKIELPGISEPVSDYFIKLSDIRVVKKAFEDKKINLIAKEIEDSILDGRVEFNPQTKQLMFYPNGTSLKLELSSTSSMVSELAPIVSYLRYVVTRMEPVTSTRRNTARKEETKALIMIEEPEAHLHPEIQIKLTELFEKLIDVNIKLIITSHSNFIFNKVNNLIIKNTHEQNDVGLHLDNVNSLVFKKTPGGSVASPLSIDGLGIDDNNFIDATEKLFEEKMQLFSDINEDDEE